jgi:energy-coupling factor transport system ATP-binding protein
MARSGDDVAFGLENRGVPAAEIWPRVDEALHRVGFGYGRDRPTAALSGGEQQRLALAGALVRRPSVLVLDEPTANLDPASARQVWMLAAALRDQGTAILAVEKNLDYVATLADRLLVLDRGRIAYDDEPRAVIDRFGQDLLQLGLLLPQTAELEIRHRTRSGTRSSILPLTVDEAVAEYRGRSFAAVPPNSAMAPVGEPVLSAEHVNFSYPLGNEALHDVSVEVREGEVLAIVGPNGSGKTTLVKSMVGLIRPASGRITVLGEDAARLSLRELARRVGFVFQDPEHQFVKDSVLEELRFSLRVAGVDEEEMGERIGPILETLGLVGLEDRHPFSLSGGQKRRLSVAVVIISRPTMLILDEPTYGQDRSGTNELMRSALALMQELDAATRAVVVVTHDMRLVSDYATRAVAMSSGRVVFDGPPADLFADADLLELANLEQPPVFSVIQRLRTEGIISSGVTDIDQLLDALSPGEGAPSIAAEQAS